MSGLRHTLGKRAYVKAYRGFESPSLRQTESRLNPRLCYFCIKGVAGIVVATEIYVPKLSDFYLTQKRKKDGTFTN